VAVPLAEQRYLLDGVIPVLELRARPRPRAAVIVLHGLTASSEVQRPELGVLAERGFAAVGVDAPHHGAREDAWLGLMAAARPPESQVLLVRLLQEAIPEVRRVIDHLVAEGYRSVGLVGISMGAYLALAVATEEPRVRATVSLLGSPDWSPRTGPITDELRELMRGAPSERPADCARHPLLLVNAGLDESVPARFARAFAGVVAERFPELARHVRYVEYPHSGHFMRAEDWSDAWHRTLELLSAELG
jgi:alpha-beta hydrolase superfamily lysophospholipase